MKQTDINHKSNKSAVDINKVKNNLKVKNRKNTLYRLWIL